MKFSQASKSVAPSESHNIVVVVVVGPELLFTRMLQVSTRMLQVCQSVEATTPNRDPIPSELSLVVNDITSDLPTHVLAVFSSDHPRSSGPVLLEPVHYIILAAYCASLPPLRGLTSQIPDMAGRVTLPVLRFNIPSPETFSILKRFLYTKDYLALLATFLPTHSATPVRLLELDMSVDDEVTEFNEFQVILGQKFSLQVLTAHTCTLTGVWKNICALGISDPQLWDVLDLAYDLLLGAARTRYPARSDDNGQDNHDNHHVNPMALDRALRQLSRNV